MRMSISWPRIIAAARTTSLRAVGWYECCEWYEWVVWVLFGRLGLVKGRGCGAGDGEENSFQKVTVWKLDKVADAAAVYGPAPKAHKPYSRRVVVGGYTHTHTHSQWNILKNTLACACVCVRMSELGGCPFSAIPTPLKSAHTIVHDPRTHTHTHSTHTHTQRTHMMSVTPTR